MASPAQRGTRRRRAEGGEKGAELRCLGTSHVVYDYEVTSNSGHSLTDIQNVDGDLNTDSGGGCWERKSVGVGGPREDTNTLPCFCEDPFLW